MSEHTAFIEWHFKPHTSQELTYSRDHTVTFENGISVLNSAAPAFLGNPEATNPETLLLGSLASCHMLTFLAIAAKRGFQVSSYSDKAIGTLGKNAEGRMTITHIILKPVITFSEGQNPSADEMVKLHDSAHRNCFIANCLSAEVSIIS